MSLNNTNKHPASLSCIRSLHIEYSAQSTLKIKECFFLPEGGNPRSPTWNSDYFPKGAQSTLTYCLLWRFYCVFVYTQKNWKVLKLMLVCLPSQNLPSQPPTALSVQSTRPAPRRQLILLRSGFHWTPGLRPSLTLSNLWGGYFSAHEKDKHRKCKSPNCFWLRTKSGYKD